MSVLIYIVLYTVAVLCYFKFMITGKTKSIAKWVITSLAMAFCIFMIYESDLVDFSAVVTILLLGIPVYIKHIRDQTSHRDIR